MIMAGVVEETTLPDEDLVLSPIYTVPKKDSSARRPVFNLRHVNHQLETIHFKMTTMKDVKAAISRNTFMAKMDLKDCFWGLPIHESDRRFLGFHWRGKNFLFRGLPFGLSLAPYFITKLYRHMVEHLQAQGHQVMIYIDDILILGPTKKQCEASVAAVRDILKDLGAIVNEKKSIFTPSQTIEFLGFLLDSRTMTIEAPAKKIKNTRKSVMRLLKTKTPGVIQVTPRELASVLGKINSLADAMLSARVHTAALQEDKLRALQAQSWDDPFRLSAEAQEDARWWLQNITKMNGASLCPPIPDIQAGTDASDFGWGAWVKDPALTTIHSWGGHFSRKDAAEHINFKEMLAVKFLLMSSPIPLRGKVVDLGIDNMTTVFYVNRMGGRNSKLAKLATEIFELTRTPPDVPKMIHKASQQDRRATVNSLTTRLVALHVPGELNTLADMESRMPNCGK